MLRGAIALWALLSAGAACAQVSARVAVVSDYRYRGVSLSDERPAVQLSLSYDRDDGWYAGVFASSVRIERPPSAQVQLLPYAGYAHRLGGDASWDVGAQYTAFSGSGDYDYPEFHIGVTAQHFGLRLHYAPRYFGIPASVWYGEIEGAHPLTEHVRLFGHAGWLRRGGDAGEADEYLERHRFDARIGIGLTRSAFDLQLAWVFSDGEAGRYPLYAVCNGCAGRNSWVLGLAYSW